MSKEGEINFLPYWQTPERIYDGITPTESGTFTPPSPYGAPQDGPNKGCNQQKNKGNGKTLGKVIPFWIPFWPKVREEG